MRKNIPGEDSHATSRLERDQCLPEAAWEGRSRFGNELVLPMISHLRDSWQFRKCSVNVIFYSPSQNKSVLYILQILTYATSASVQSFPNEWKVAFPVLLLSSSLSFPNDVKWTWCLISTSTYKSLWNHLAPNKSKIYYLCLRFFCLYLHIMLILIKQYIVFSHPSATSFLELIDLLPQWFTVCWTKPATVPGHTS